MRLSLNSRFPLHSPFFLNLHLPPPMSLTVVDKSLDTLDLNALWAEMAGHIRTSVSTDSYDRWFRSVELVELGEKELTLRVPSHIYQLWIESNYLNALSDRIDE